MKVKANLDIQGTLKVGNAAVVTTVPHLLAINAAGDVQKVVNNFSPPPTYQISTIVNGSPGRITVMNLPTTDGEAVGLNVGSYTCKFDFEFGNISNSTYRFAAKRTLEFSFIVYNWGQITVHSLPVLHVTSQSGMMVRADNKFTWDVKANDIVFDAVVISDRLYIDVISNLHISAYSVANGSFQARFRAEIRKFNFQSGGGDLSS